MNVLDTNSICQQQINTLKGNAEVDFESHLEYWENLKGKQVTYQQSPWDLLLFLQKSKPNKLRL